MCLIIYKPAGVKFNLEHIENALLFNGDGMGLSMRDDSGLKVYRGIDLDTLIENESILTSKEVVLHLRYGTSGKMTTRQVHPFLVGKKTTSRDYEVKGNDKILFHNGVMFSPKNDYSDTQIFARGLFDIEKGINKHLASNRFLVQSEKENFFYGQWHEVEGMKYSNMSYHGGPSYRDYSNEFFDVFHKCPTCGGHESELISYKHDIFECFDCNTVFTENKILIK